MPDYPTVEVFQNYIFYYNEASLELKAATPKKKLMIS